MPEYTPGILLSVLLKRFDDPSDMRSVAEECIKRHGWTPEHNYEGFLYQMEKGNQGVFFQSAEGYGLLGYFSPKGTCELFSEPMGPAESRGALIAAFCRESFSFSETTSVSLEITSASRAAFLKEASPAFSVRRTTRNYIWPILNLRTYDEALAGSEFKALRNVRNRFTREHTLRIAEATQVPAAPLHAVVDAWSKNRPATDPVHSEQYHRAIDERFAGTVGAKVFIIDHKPEALLAGWPIPNSPRTYYPFLMLHSYAHWGLGEMLMLEALGWMKGEGYDFTELGGCDRKLLAFKEKFGEIKTYMLHWFSVVRNEEPWR